MARSGPPAPEGALPVDPERLRRQFPALSDEDLAAYVEVTREILAAPAPERARRTRDVLAAGRRAREAGGGAGAPGAAERRAARYLAAIEKMQGRTS